MSPLVRVVLMVLRGDELLLVASPQDPARLEFPSTVLVAGEAFKEACGRVARDHGLPASAEPVFQRLSNTRTAKGDHEVHVGFLATVARDFEPDAGRFHAHSALPDALDATSRDALVALSQEKGFVDLVPPGEPKGEPPAASEKSVASVDFLPVSGEVESDPTRTADGAEATGAASEDRVTHELTDFPDSERVTPEFARPAVAPRAPSMPPPLPGDLVATVPVPVRPFTLWFAGALVWATAVALAIEHQQVAPADVVFVAWGTLVVTSLLVITRESLPKAKDEDPPPIRRWLLVLGSGFSMLFGVALFMSVFAGALRAAQAYFLLGVIGMAVFFLARDRAAKTAPPVPRTRFAEAGRLSVWLFLVFVSLFLFVAGPG
jgi:hypothetical protein